MGRWAPLHIAVDGHDRHRVLTAVAALGLVAGGVMAVVGLPPVDVHGPLHYVGIMGPFCGATRGMKALMGGDLAMAWTFNPAVFPIALGAAALLVRHTAGWTTGRWLNVRIADRRVFWSITAALLIVLEVNQQASADLLRTPPDRFSFLAPFVFSIVPALSYLAVHRRLQAAVRRRQAG